MIELVCKNVNVNGGEKKKNGTKMQPQLIFFGITA